MLVSARGRRLTGTRARARRAVQRRGRRGVDRGSTPAMPVAVAGGGLALGVLLEYLLYPRVGRRRRHRARDRALSRLRRGERRALVRVRRAESHAIGVARERHEDIERMGEEARRIDGVRAVENLVHPPGTLAPTSRSKLERQRAAE